MTTALALPEATNAEVVAKTTAINDAYAALVKVLKVESVSAITKTYVEVKFDALTEALPGATVEVKNDKGNVVATKSADIAKGATFAQFDFITPFTDAKHETGVWTVDAEEYSFTAIKQLTDIKALAAATPVDQLALSNALIAAGITDVDNTLLETYATDITAATLKIASLADLQEVVTKTNTTAATIVADAAALKAVVEAKTQIELYNALSTNFDRVNSKWSLAYASGTTSAAGIKITPVVGAPNANVIYKDASSATGTTKADIQTAIDAVNAAQIAAAPVTTSVEQAAVTALIQNWVKADDPKTPTVTPKADAIKASQVAEHVLKVAEAETANTVYSALVNLATLDATGLKTTDLDSTLAVRYFTEQQKAGVQTAIKGTRTAAQVKTSIVDPAKAAVAGDLLAAAQAPVASDTAGVAADEAAVKVALEKYGVKNVLPTGYLTVAAKSAISNAGVTNLATLQTAVDAQGLIEVKAVIAAGTLANAADEAKASQYLTAYGVKNVLPTGYLTTAAKSDIAAAGVNDLATLQTAVDTATLVVNQTAQLKVINKATDANTVNTALLTLGLPGYLDVPSVDRLDIAARVLVARNAQGGTTAGEFDAYSDLTTALGTASTTGILKDYADAVDGINAFENLDGTPTTISGAVTALEKVGNVEFNAMLAGPKALVAETFLSSLTYDETGKVSPKFGTLTAVNVKLNAAIAAQ